MPDVMLAAMLRPARHWLGLADLERDLARETNRLRTSITLERGRGNQLEVELEGLKRSVALLEDRVAELDTRRCHAVTVERT